MDQTLHRVATKDRVQEIKRTTTQKMASRHNKEGGNHLEQESNRQKTMEDTDGGQHPAVDEQSLGKRRKANSKLAASCVLVVCLHFNKELFFWQW